MALIIPTITAYDSHDYRAQIERVATFASRLHIDLMDGDFAPTKSPPVEQIWWPSTTEADVHLMYRRPMPYLNQLIKLRPRMVIIHAEAEVDHMLFAAELHEQNILTGLAILQDTPLEQAFKIINSFDHVLVFSGRLGYHGGTADLGLLDRVGVIRDCHPDAEIGWDGGISDKNIDKLIRAGIEVLNVGGFIHKSEDPANAYATLKALADNRDEK